MTPISAMTPICVMTRMITVDEHLTWLRLCVGDPNHFSGGIGIDLFFCVGIENGFLGFVYTSRLTWFLWRSIKIGITLEWGSKLTWFQWWVENTLAFVWGWNCTRFFYWWSKSTWFQCGGSILSWFQRRDRNRLRFGVGIENKNELILVSGSKWNCFFCVEASKLNWI